MGKGRRGHRAGQRRCTSLSCLVERARIWEGGRDRQLQRGKTIQGKHLLRISTLRHCLSPVNKKWVGTLLLGAQHIWGYPNGFECGGLAHRHGGLRKWVCTLRKDMKSGYAHLFGSGMFTLVVRQGLAPAHLYYTPHHVQPPLHPSALCTPCLLPCPSPSQVLHTCRLEQLADLQKPML